MKMQKRILAAILTIICAAVILFIPASTKSTASSDEHHVHCYIVVEPAHKWYVYGETITLIAMIEENPSGDAATPTDLKNNGEWSIVWQRNDNDRDEGSWYNVGTGWRYQFEVNKETASAWFRFVAMRGWNE